MGKPKTDQWSVTLTPHRSLTRQGLLAVMVAVTASNLAAGILFLMLGAWPVIGFMGLDVVLIWFAFRWNIAAGRRSEHIVASGDELKLLRLSSQEPAQEIVFNRRWVQVHLEFDEARELVGRLYLRSHGKLHEIAAFLGAEERRSLAKALQQSI